MIIASHAITRSRHELGNWLSGLAVCALLNGCAGHRNQAGPPRASEVPIGIAVNKFVKAFPSFQRVPISDGSLVYDERTDVGRTSVFFDAKGQASAIVKITLLPYFRDNADRKAQTSVIMNAFGFPSKMDSGAAKISSMGERGNGTWIWEKPHLQLLMQVHEPDVNQGFPVLMMVLAGQTGGALFNDYLANSLYKVSDLKVVGAQLPTVPYIYNPVMDSRASINPSLRQASTEAPPIFQLNRRVADFPRYERAEIPSPFRYSNFSGYSSDSWSNSNGLSTVRDGNYYYYSNGGSSVRMGNTWFHSSGNSSTLVGDTFYHSNGGWTRREGNTFIRSDGSSYQRYYGK